MIVYRYLTNDEVNRLMYKMKFPIGEVPTAKQLVSSRKYKRGVKYLHFFRSLDDFPTVRQLDSAQGGKFIGMFDIPLRVLLGGYGVGEFTGTPIEGTDKYVAMKEYAVELKDLRSEYLIDYVYDEFGDLTIEELKEVFEESAQVLE